MSKLENDYQLGLRKRIEERFPDCIVLKNDEQLCQGIFDLTVMYGPCYAALEVKRDLNEARNPGPNQAYYLARVAEMGAFSAFIYPEIEEEVLDALQRAFEANW
jgi:hypothetical protein